MRYLALALLLVPLVASAQVPPPADQAKTIAYLRQLLDEANMRTATCGSERDQALSEIAKLKATKTETPAPEHKK